MYDVIEVQWKDTFEAFVCLEYEDVEYSYLLKLENQKVKVSWTCAQYPMDVQPPETFFTLP